MNMGFITYKCLQYLHSKIQLKKKESCNLSDLNSVVMSMIGLNCGYCTDMCLHIGYCVELCLISSYCKIVCLYSRHCADSFAGYLVLLGI